MVHEPLLVKLRCDFAFGRFFLVQNMKPQGHRVVPQSRRCREERKTKKSWWPVSRYKMSDTPQTASVTGIWYSGIMLASGARGPGFNSRNPPIMIGPTATGGSVIRYSEAHRQEYNFFCQNYKKMINFFFGCLQKTWNLLIFLLFIFGCLDVIRVQDLDQIKYLSSVQETRNENKEN